MKYVLGAKCVKCGREYAPSPDLTTCSCGGILDILEERRISHCYFGHIHGQYAARKALVGEYRGVRMHLISCDFVNFTPVLVAKG